MAIIQLSEEDFYKYRVGKNIMASTFGTETGWFQETNYNLLAIIINDKIDKDWSVVILSNEEDDEYRAIDVAVSIETVEEAESELKKRIRNQIATGKFRDSIYKEDETKDVEKEKKQEIDLETPKQIIIKSIDDEVKIYFKKHPERLYELSSRKFEELVASILNDMGLDVQLTKATRDGGSDIIASIKNSLTSILILVECKRYAPENKVSVGIIREVAGVHTFRKPEKSIIVTTSTFTKSAIKEAELLNGKMELKDYDNLKDWLSVY
jgi:restriction endonuclease Mrr